MNRRDFSAALISSTAAATLFASASTWAQAPGPVEGKDFSRVDPPQPLRAGGKIEVLEFFSYACPHCNAFEPSLETWARQLPSDVVFRRVPVAFMMNAENFQRTYYALEATGQVDAMQMKIFRAIHVDRQRLEKPEEIADLVAKSGGDGTKFLAAFKSFSVATAVSRAKKLMVDLKVDSVPTLVVNGRFVTSPAQAGGMPQALAVTEQLVQKARKV